MKVPSNVMNGFVLFKVEIKCKLNEQKETKSNFMF